MLEATASAPTVLDIDIAIEFALHIAKPSILQPPVTPLESTFERSFIHPTRAP
jgi:hypothetical protein